MLMSEISRHCCVVFFVTLASNGAVGRPVIVQSTHSLGAASTIAPPLQSLPLGAPTTSKVYPVSPLTYRKAFKIRIPLKPKIIKHIQILHKKRNQSAKRDTKHAHYYERKHVPFFRSVRMLFDDILNRSKDLAEPQRAESTSKNQVHEFKIDPLSEITSSEHASSGKKQHPKNIPHDKKHRNSEETKATIDSTKAAETSSDSTSTTEAPLSRTIPAPVSSTDVSLDDAGSPLPILPTTDTVDGRRAHERHLNRSSPADNADNQGSVSRYRGHNQNVSQIGKPGNISEGLSKPTNDAPRDSANSSGSNEAGRQRRVTSSGLHPTTTRNVITKTEECTPKTGAGIKQFEVKNKIKGRRNQDESARHGNRLRGNLATIEEYVVEESVQPQDNIEQGIICDTHGNTHDKQRSGRNSTVTEQVEVPQGTEVNPYFGIVIDQISKSETQMNSPIEIVSGYSNYTIADSSTKP